MGHTVIQVAYPAFETFDDGVSRAGGSAGTLQYKSNNQITGGVCAAARGIRFPFTT